MYQAGWDAYQEKFCAVIHRMGYVNGWILYDVYLDSANDIMENILFETYVKCMEGYDPALGKFETYAYSALIRAVAYQKRIRFGRKNRCRMLPLNEVLFDNGGHDKKVYRETIQVYDEAMNETEWKIFFDELIKKLDHETFHIISLVLQLYNPEERLQDFWKKMEEWGYSKYQVRKSLAGNPMLLECIA